MARPTPTPNGRGVPRLGATRLRASLPAAPLLLCSVALLGAGMLGLSYPTEQETVSRLPALPGVPLSAYPSHRLSIDERQQLQLDGVALERPILKERLQGLVRMEPQSILRVRAYAGLPYEVVRTITHDAYLAGFALVELEVEPERSAVKP